VLKAGTAKRYRVVSQYRFDDVLFDLDVTYAQRVIEVSRDGIATLELMPTQGTLKQRGGIVGGQVDPEHPPRFTAKVNSAGMLIEFRGLICQDVQDFAGVWGVVDPIPLYNWFVGFSGFPEDDVNVGDTWGDPVTIDFPDSGRHQVHSSSQLLRFEKIGQRECAVVQSEVTLPVGSMDPAKPGQSNISMQGDGDMKIKTTNYVDLRDGTLIRSEGSFASKVEYHFAMNDGSSTTEFASKVAEHSGDIRVTLE